MTSVPLSSNQIVFSRFLTYRNLDTEDTYVGNDAFLFCDDTDCEERGGGGVNSIIQQESTWETKKRQD